MANVNTRATFNINLPGALPGFAGAVRHVLAMLAKNPQAIKGGLFYQLPGSLRERLLALGMPEGLAPEFTGVIQHLGVARFSGRATWTVWYLLDPTFAEEFLMEPWVTKAFEAHLDRADLFEQIRDLRAQKESLTVKTPPSADKVAVTFNVKEQLRAFFVRMFRDYHDPSRGAGLFLTTMVEKAFEADFTFDLKAAIGWMVEDDFLSTSDRHPRLIWKGHNYLDQMATVSHIRLAGR